MKNDVKRNLLLGSTMKHLPLDSKLLYFIALELADPSGLFDTSYPLEAYDLPLTALVALANAGMVIHFVKENVAVIVHWALVATAYQKGKNTLFPEVKDRLATKDGKYYLKD